jgi:hypothetical protein
MSTECTTYQSIEQVTGTLSRGLFELADSIPWRDNPGRAKYGAVGQDILLLRRLAATPEAR